MIHVVCKDVLEVLFIIFFNDLLEEIIRVPVMEPWAPTHLLVPSVTKVVASALSPSTVMQSLQENNFTL